MSKKQKKELKMSVEELAAWLQNALRFVRANANSEAVLRDFETEFSATIGNNDEYQYLAVYSKEGISATLVKETAPHRIEKLQLKEVVDVEFAAKQIWAFLQ